MSSGWIRQIIVIAAAAGCALGQSAGTFSVTGSMTTALSYLARSSNQVTIAIQ
jgi:hypothetical protein